MEGEYLKTGGQKAPYIVQNFKGSVASFQADPTVLWKTGKFELRDLDADYLHGSK